MLNYFAQLLDGVEVAHLQKVIHRDLIPICVLMDKFEWQQMHANAEQYYLLERNLVSGRNDAH